MRGLLALLVCSIGLSVAPVAAWAQSEEPPEWPPAISDTLVTADSAAAGGRPRAVDYLWVLRSSLVHSASIDSVVARARAAGVRGLLVQVVGRGDSYYRSSLLPRAEVLSDADANNPDPLAAILERAHAAGLEVHAWVNCMLVWSGPRRPSDPRHVVNAHPEWVARLRDGRLMSHLRPYDFKRLGVEGVFLNPSHPRVRTWVARVAQEIVKRYPVDGIHLDYIRLPDAPVGYDQTSRARFALETGVDPRRFDRLQGAQRAAIDSAWRAFQCAQVTAVVREVRDSVRAVRDDVVLSAAVVADTLKAERWNGQPWRAWVRDGLLDRAFLMCYAPSVQKVMDQLMALAQEFGTDARLVPGIAVYNTPLTIAALKIKGAREIGYPLLALYSYDSLFEHPSAWARLSAHLDGR
jgi:uncharacterized lipoprotein YddW (UPF0748 family)